MPGRAPRWAAARPKAVVEDECTGSGSRNSRGLMTSGITSRTEHAMLLLPVPCVRADGGQQGGERRRARCAAGQGASTAR